MPTLPTLLLGLVLLVPQVRAQESKSSRQVNLSLACFRYVNGINKAQLAPIEGEGLVEIAFYQGGFTQPAKVKIRENSVELLASEPAADGTTTMKKIAVAKIPEEMKDVSLLLLPAPAGSGFIYTALVMPRQSEFPFGQVMAMNLTTGKVSFAIGQKVVELQPGQTRFSDPKPFIDDFNMYPVAVAYQPPDGSEWLTLHTTRWQWNDRIRQIAIAWYDNETRKMEVSTMRDIQPVVAPPAGDAP